MSTKQNYIAELDNLKNQRVIKLITGLSNNYKEEVLSKFKIRLNMEGVQNERIHSIRFTSSLFTPEDILERIKSILVEGKMSYIFLYEIHNLPHFDILLLELFKLRFIDIYAISSSNICHYGSLLKNLRGKYKEINILPLSYKAYCSHLEPNHKENLISYITYGTTINPSLGTSLSLISEIENHYNSVLFSEVQFMQEREDLLTRNINNIPLLKSISRYLMLNIGKKVTVMGITEDLRKHNMNASTITVKDYIDALCDCFIFYPLSLYEANTHKVLETPKKYYVAPLSFMEVVVNKTLIDTNALYESIIYFELLRRGYKVYHCRYRSTPITFMAEQDNMISYIQVALEIKDDSTFSSLSKPFRKLKNSHNIILTSSLNYIDTYDNFSVIDLTSWLFI